MGFLVFSVVHPKSKRNVQPLLPTLLQGMFCPRPARMVPSITHGLILAPLASSREREPAHLPGRELQPPTVAASLELCPAVNRPWASWLWASSCMLPSPWGRGRKEGGCWGRGKRAEGEGPPSLIS